MARTGGRSWKRTALWTLGTAVVVFGLIQLVPYGRSSHTNPSAANPFKWTNPKAETVARTACYDCHSNETKWWWATDIAPFSWLVQHDVAEGRARLNFSDYTGEPSVDEFRRVVEGGGMPPLQYTAIHSNAKLSAAERQTLIQGYAAGQTATNGAGGSTGSTSGGSTPAPSASAGASTAQATAAIQRDCSACHAPDPALAYTASSTAEAQALIDSMVQRGAQVSAQDRQLMLQYFTR